MASSRLVSRSKKAQNQKWFCAFSFYSTAFGFFVEKPRCIVSL
nr:MAG TPA: hypothetical protein [Caudoviricetes sp.]DAT82113.1 MAG TPA: hypothetical protein [Caudoviricetes sp.]